MMALALLLSFVSGFIALSYEIVWFRAFSVGMSGRAQAFALLLVGYLTGIALGSWLSRRVCEGAAPTRRAIYVLAASVFAANVLGFLFVPWLADLMTWPRPWLPSVGLLAVTVTGLGSVFPLVAQMSIPRGSAVGRQFSYVYAANILGSTLGSVLTGFVLLDRLTAEQVTTGLGIAGIASAAGIVAIARPTKRAMGAAGLVCAFAAVGMWRSAPALFDGVYEKLVFMRLYQPGERFAHVIETRSGVVAVTKEGVVYGGGVYDGAVNTDLRRDELNGVHRPYMVGALHPKPRRVLVVGLGAGAWAAVLAHHPEVEHVTVVEIDRGHLQLLTFYPEMVPLLSNPKVTIELDDIRHWLARHPDERFDLVMANPSFDWRANATSLFSMEYLALIREHLNPGGVYFYNTTGADRVTRTGSLAFPYAWRIGVMLAVSDTPFVPDFERFRQQLSVFQMYGRPALDLNVAADRAVFEHIVTLAAADVESRDSLLTRMAHLAPITDDNMGTEWWLAHPLQFWRY